MGDLNDPFVKAPTKTSDGRPWTQRCYVCSEAIDFLKDPGGLRWLRVGPYVRHRKCYPPPIK